MKRLFVLGLPILAMLIMGGCGFGKMVTRYPEVTVTLDNPDLENKGGEVNYTIKGTIPPKYMKKKALMTLSPCLKVDGVNATPFTTIKLKGEKAKGEGQVISFKNGGTFTKTGSFKFSDNCEEAVIVAPATAQIKKKSTTLNPEKELGEGISNTCSFISLQPTISDDTQNGANFLNAPHQYATEFVGKTATIYFDLNSSNMNWSNKYNKDQAAKDSIRNFINFLNEDLIIDKVVISGWASPEGEESNNQGLSERRFQQGKKWFEDQYDKYLKDCAKKNKIKLKDLQRPTFTYVNNAKGEDWDGFEAAIAKSNMSQKNQILNVVKSQPNNDMREQKIREMTDIYPEIADVILPPLRRAEMQVICKKHESYTDAELVALVKAHPADFSINERLYAASVANNNEDKEVIYKDLIRNDKTQNDWRAYNNLGAMYLNDYYQTGNSEKLDDAINYLTKADAISPNNGIILNNLALAEFLKGNMADARTKFEASESATVFPVDQSYAKGMYSIVDGDYFKATQLLNNHGCDYNTALVQILNKDYPAAQKTLDCMKHIDAKTYYLKAILAARLKDENGVYDNLRNAIQQDPNLKKKAKRDAEFKRYRHSDTFKQIVK